MKLPLRKIMKEFKTYSCWGSLESSLVGVGSRVVSCQFYEMTSVIQYMTKSIVK
jgi:hypothetical protein